jgi:hypothetical protein
MKAAAMSPWRCGVAILAYLATVLALTAMPMWTASAAAQSIYSHPHYQHAVCRELKVDLQVTGSSTDGLTLLRVDILRRGMGVEFGHGVKFFVDGRLRLLDENVRSDSYGLEWKVSDAAGLKQMHYLVVNVCDHNDHIGVATLRFQPGTRLGLLEPDAAPQPAGQGDFIQQAKGVACCGDGIWPDLAQATASTWVDRD